MINLVSVIITAHNYGRFLDKCISSVLEQTYENIEIIVVNDGSQDNTNEVLKTFAKKIKVINLPGVGLAKASNVGIRNSKGKYVIRLDADDWFDKNIIKILVNYLIKNTKIGMVFCDFFHVDIEGKILLMEKRMKITSKHTLLDRPCLAAGAMFRRECFNAIGGYNEKYRFQEDYDFWIKFREKFLIRNINTPLMYYRKHSNSMSTNYFEKTKVRQKVKRDFIKKFRKKKLIIGVIPARSDFINNENYLLFKINGKTLIEIAIKKLKLDLVKRVFVMTNDEKVSKLSKRFGAEVPFIRKKDENHDFCNTLNQLLYTLGSKEKFSPDLIALVFPHSPLINKNAVEEAINTALIYQTDSVVGVTEDKTFHWAVGDKGLEKVGYKNRETRYERELVYREAGGVYILKNKKKFSSNNMFGKKIGHIEFSNDEVLRIHEKYDCNVAEILLKKNE